MRRAATIAALFGVGVAGLASCASDPPVESFDEPVRYKDVVELFDQGISRTCSLNGGVCHNSNSYPDLHSVSAVLATANRPCNAGSIDRNEVNDACEPPADHLVMPSFNVDSRIVWAETDPAEANLPYYALSTVTMYIDPEPPFLPAGGGDVEIHRSTGEVFSISGRGAFLMVHDGNKLVFNLSRVAGSDKQFFDVRVFPPGPDRLWVGDENHNGIEGARVQSMKLMVPGDAMGSYLVHRLIDDSFGERMPRQCRTWDDRANLAMACWIQGLKTDEHGAITNALAPIDYDHCGIDVVGKGRCAPAGGVGLPAVEDIFNRSCGGGACHVDQDAPQDGLDLSPGKVRASVVGIAAKGRPDMQLVVPGDPGQSYLWCKLNNDCPLRAGDRMPALSPPLAPAELETVRAWIADGATE
ncbi:MAG TPA: hypothetical protein VHE35_16815, partial [Kofleriaceae bacterium]|nr:hypothetical protein [Kofleriaceae bacterium]